MCPVLLKLQDRLSPWHSKSGPELDTRMAGKPPTTRPETCFLAAFRPRFVAAFDLASQRSTSKKVCGRQTGESPLTFLRTGCFSGAKLSKVTLRIFDKSIKA